MKKNLFGFLMLLAAILLNTLSNLQGAPPADPAVLNGIDAHRALAIANEWRWSHPEIRSYITSKEVGIKFPDGRIAKIPLPEESMMVAIAPYLNQTHT